MADDDKPAEEPKPIEPVAPEAKAEPHPRNPKSEWTASDERGPLERAHENAELGHEGERRPPEAGEPVDARAPAVSDERAETFGSDPQIAPPTPTSVASDASAASPSPDRRRGRSIWPVAAAIVLGAVIGAGTAYVDGRYLQGESSGASPDVESLKTRVDALEKRPDSQAAVAEIRSSVTALANKVAQLEKAPPRSSGEKAPDISKTPDVSQGPPPASAAADLGPLNQKITQLQADLAALKAQGSDVRSLQDRLAAVEGAVVGMKTATAAAQAGVTSVEGQQKALAGRVMVPALAVVTESLVRQIELGQPFSAQVDALASLGVDPAKLGALREYAEQGVPSARSLAAKFEPLAESVATTTRTVPPNAGFFDRLKSGMLSLVSIRRADDTSGTDLPSRVARIKAALAHDDVPGAVAAWEALPPDAKAKSTGWGALAKTSADAMTTARALQRDAIVALGAKKS